MPASPLRVTHLLHTMAYGGIETVILNWLTHLDPTEVETQLVVFDNPGQTQKPFLLAAQERGIRVEQIPWSARKPFLSAAQALRPFLQEHQTQVLHTHNTYADLVGLLAGRIEKCQLVSTIYVWEDGGFGLRRKLLQKMGAWVLHRFDLLTAQCQKTIQESAQWGFDPNAVRLAPSGFDAHPRLLSETQRTALRAERGVDSPEELIVCNVARFYPEKAQDLALRCWAEVTRHHPKAQLWFYGVGPLEEDLRRLTEELNLTSSVRFCGFAQDLALELELCDIQFHPSHNEGIPLAICSGMAAGLPIVAAEVGGIPEVIEDRQSGLLIADNDQAGFVRALCTLLADAPLRHTLGAGAQRFIREEYSLESAAQSLVDSYKLTLGKSHN